MCQSDDDGPDCSCGVVGGQGRSANELLGLAAVLAVLAVVMLIASTVGVVMQATAN